MKPRSRAWIERRLSTSRDQLCAYEERVAHLKRELKAAQRCVEHEKRWVKRFETQLKELEGLK